MSSVNIIVHRNPCLTSSVGLSYTNADKKGLRPICNPYNTCNTCPAPPSHTSLSLLTSSCSTTVPLLEPYYIISIDLKKKKHGATPDCLYTFTPPPPSMKQLILHDYSYFNILSALHSFHLVSCTHNISTLCLSILLATLPVIVPKFIVRRVISRFQSFLFLPPKCPIIPAFWSLEKSTVW